MENPTRGFKETKLVLYSARIKIANKSKTVMSWISHRKLRAFFVLFILSKEIFFFNICFISVYSVSNKFSEYTYFYLSKHITLYTFLLVSKIVESLQYP